MRFAGSSGLLYPLTDLILAPGARISSSNVATGVAFSITPSADNAEAFNFFRSLEGPGTATNDALLFIGRVDWNINDANRVNVRYNFSDNEAVNGVSTGDLAGLPFVNRPLSNDGEVVIGNNVWLGDSVAVLDGARIGDGCVIGAHSVVNGPLPANTICVGAPARPIRQWNPARHQWERINHSP